ncbi:AAA family ATPase [Micromonospora narathiwatensis]|uniref:Predicted kinase n=1 Tax=Micromonospora narathiwatensis TaxID=299146 RepID=A0A1A8ZAF5_9ACTN|nr:AAA family ATPase [Micromonospora narathiwatensis]SBT40811.1 Predicted kinase [Micromonospora narathiwatensis]
MIVQLAGLPGTGKSSLAAALRAHLGHGCLVLDKDHVRAALYEASGQVTYRRDQDDFVVSLLHQAAREHLTRQPDATVILERTCTRRYQIDDVVRLAAGLHQPLAIIRCWCPDPVARARLDADRQHGQHPAADRGFALYQQLRATAEPISVPALHLRTDTTAARILTAAVDYLHDISTAPAPVEGAAR